MEVHILTNLDTSEVLAELFELHPEGSIVFIPKFDCFFGFLGPAIRLVTPIASPFEGAPWISNLNKPNLLTVFVFHLGAGEETIGVSAYESERFQSFGFFIAARRYTGSHDVIVEFALDDLFPDRIFLVFIWLGHYFPSRCTCDISEGLVALSTNDSVI